MEFNPWAKPGKVKKLRSFKLNQPLINEEEYLRRMNLPKFDEPVPQRETSILDKIKSAFNL
jgi:hypothetical protein